MMEQDQKRLRAQRAAAVKAERKARAGLSRTTKLRLYPLPDQAAHINRTIGTIRFVWNTIWLPMLQEAQRARAAHAERNGNTKEAWREAWRIHPDPTEAAYTRARTAVAAPGAGREWIADALLTPLTRAARNFADAVKASRGRTRNGTPRKARAGRVQPRDRRDDARRGLEWQLQGTAPLGGRELARVIDMGERTVTVPGLGRVRFEDRCRLIRPTSPQGSRPAR
jgi:hypothetical protein